MTATVLAVVPLTRAVQYDGTNSADIDAAITDLTIVSEGGGTLTIESNGNQYPVPTNGYLVYNQLGIVMETMTDDYFADYFQILATPADLEDLATQAELEALEEGLPDSVQSVGVATFGAILAGQSAVVPVTLTPAMPSSSYTPNTPKFFGGANIGSLAINAVSVVNASTVNVTVQNNGIISIGASVLVTA